jgi:spore coat protein U-like protein
MSCTVDTGPVMLTGYNPADVLPLDGTGYFEVDCTCTVILGCLLGSYSTEIQSGPTSPATDRRMTNIAGSDILKYSLYKDLLHVGLWDVGSNASGGSIGLGQLGLGQRATVYGRIPAGQVVPSGTYRDTPAVVVTY